MKKNILQGVLIGVSSGVISGVILGFVFWMTDFVENRNEKRDQIQYLASEIAEFRELIYRATKLDGTIEDTGEKRQVSKDEIRKAYYDSMRRQVDSILRERASRLSYGEIREVRRVFYTGFSPDVVWNDTGYDLIFGRLESIKWLNLPPRLP